MIPAQQVPRTALAWIILSQALLLLPHITRIPLWVVAVYAAAFGWRVQMFRGRAEAPGRWLKLVLSAAAGLGIVASYGNLLGMEPMVAFLLVAFALKLTEMQSRRDAFTVVFLGYFICVTAFLFSQDILLVLYVLLLVLCLTAALIYLHRPDSPLGDVAPLRLASVMLLQAFPLMLVLFFLFPRIGPLWSVPLKSHTAKTGMSDVLRPGDVSSLSQSGEVAFRAQFNGDIPGSEALYWRGIVMSRLDDGAWRSLRYFEIPPRERKDSAQELRGERLSYSVIMEPTQRNWVYSLAYARSSKPGLMSMHDFRLYSPVAIESEMQYNVESWPDALLEPQLSSWRRTVETELPNEDNPRTAALAASLRAQSSDNRVFIDRVLDYFRSESFFYTLEPPRLSGNNPMDEFLFETRRGFCEHYAYAFAVMMRSVGIPTRIVGGYLGGEVNPVNRTVIVHQFDAHAWNEVWLEGEGWVRVDPTAAVAPDRILYGLERAVAEEGSFLASSPLSPLRYRGVNWLNSLRLRYDALTWQWQTWVTGFDGQTQFDLLRGVLGEISVTRSLAVLLGSGVLTLAVVSLFLFGRSGRTPSRSKSEEELLRFQQMLVRRGLSVQPGETPESWIARAVERWPKQAARLRQHQRDLNQLLYQRPQNPDSSDRLLKSLRTRYRGLQATL
ncbi:MAG: protein-glutamine gamma-glutamyltransferase TgpA [Congregibacter sp.]